MVVGPQSVPISTNGRISFRRGVLDIKLFDKSCQRLMTGQWFSLSTLVSSTNKTVRHDIGDILLKVVLNTITHPPIQVHLDEIELLLH